MKADATSISARFVAAQGWWIVSELIARNPDLYVEQLVDLVDGESLVVRFEGPDDNAPTLGRSVQVVVGRRGLDLLANVLFETLGWEDILAADGPHDVVERIEASAGLVSWKVRAQALSGAALMCSVIAGLLAARVNSERRWYVRSSRPTVVGVDSWVPAALPEFPTLAPSENVPTWLLYRGYELAVAFDEGANLHVHGQSFDLREFYEDSGFDIEMTLVAVARLIG